MKSVQIINRTHPHFGEVGWLLPREDDNLHPNTRDAMPDVRIVRNLAGKEFAVWPGDWTVLSVPLSEHG